MRPACHSADAGAWAASDTVQFHLYNAMFAGEESLRQLFRACSAERLFYTDVARPPVACV